MIFGRQPQRHAAPLSSTAREFVRGRMRGIWWLFATLLVVMPLALLSAGCGGSSSSGPGGGSSQSRDAKITGRLVDQYNNLSPVAGATVRYGGVTAFSGVDGTFSLSVSSGQPRTTLTVQSPANVNYYSTGTINSQPYDLKNVGFAIGPLSPNQTFSTGDIILYSDSGPPPPPIF